MKKINFYYNKQIPVAPIAQWPERSLSKRNVGGSNPPGGFLFNF